MTMEGVQQAIKIVGERMGCFTLKDEQLRIAADVLGGRDGFVCLPTGMDSHSVTPFCLGHSMSYRE